jgi:hypothetical protein
MNNHGDIAFGVVGTIGTIGLGTINVMLGCFAGILTCGVMLLRLRKEWRNRDK